MSMFQALLFGVTGVSAAVVHYPPASTTLNNLTFVLQGTGTPANAIFNSSVTPDKEYASGIFNQCNMPHTRAREYLTPAKEFELQFAEVIHRHHKRTTYASNTFFLENYTWDCDGSGPVAGLASPEIDITQVDWQASRSSANPFTDTVGPGFPNSTCQFPGITDDGLHDSFTHGSDLRGVYAKRLGLKDKYDPSIARIRVTNNVITSQVASGLLPGLFPGSSGIEVEIQSPSFDSLEPLYPCPVADSLHANYTTGSNGQLWQQHLEEAAPLYAKLDQVSGISNPDTGGWHVSFDHYYDNLSVKQCHGKALPCSVNDTSLCVTQDEADTVFRLGYWEYDYQFRSAPDSTLYSTLHYGAYVLELKSHLMDVMEGKTTLKYMHNIAHDGSLSPLLGILQVDIMGWPGMGSEVVFELYKNTQSNKYFIRVLWGGQAMKTSTPLGTLDMVKIEDFFSYIDSMIGTGSDLLNACNSS